MKPDSCNSLVSAGCAAFRMEVMAASTVLAHRKIQAKALLWAADGVAKHEIARRSEVDSDTVSRWRRRFGVTGVEGVGRIASGPAVLASGGDGGRGGAVSPKESDVEKRSSRERSHALSLGSWPQQTHIYLGNLDAVRDWGYARDYVWQRG